MHRPVRFADDIERLVQFIEETDASRVLEATLGKLRDGLSVKKLLTASAVAISAASRAGLYKGSTTTAVPSRICLVMEAQCATIIKGDAHRQ